MKTLQRYIIIDRGKQEITDTDKTKRYTVLQMKNRCVQAATDIRECDVFIKN